VRAEVLEGEGSVHRNRYFIRWPTVFAYACLTALIAGGIYGWVGGTHLGKPKAKPAPLPAALEVAEVAPQAVPVTPQPVASPGQEEHPGWRHVDLGTVGQLTVSESASLRLPANEASPHAGYTVGLDSGEMCAAIAHRDVPKEGPFVVETASLRVVVVGTRFCVSAGETTDASWVSVQDGQVRVERSGRSAMVSAGETLHGGDPLLAAPKAKAVHSVKATSASTSTCPATDPLPTRRRCLWRLAGGDDLAAQNALYTLGLLARDQEGDGVAALSIWQTYRHRFAHGVMAAEVDLAVLSELTSQGRYGDALNVSDEFLAEYPSYFHAGEVRLKRADLLRTRLGRPAEAQDAYRNILATESSPALRGEALFGLGLSQEAMGLAADAQTTWNRYQMEFPGGRHSSEVSRRLHGTASGP
jgi:hypothetical protein